MPKRKKNMASDKPVMFPKRSQNAQPQNEILCSKGAWGQRPQQAVCGYLDSHKHCLRIFSFIANQEIPLRHKKV